MIKEHFLHGLKDCITKLEAADDKARQALLETVVSSCESLIKEAKGYGYLGAPKNGHSKTNKSVNEKA